MREIFGRAIGQGPFEVVPDEFIGIEFGRISRKPVGVQARVRAEKLLDHDPFMGPAGIPKQDHGAPEVLEQMAEESGDLGGADVGVWMEAGIECDSPLLGGHAEGRDGRNLAPAPRAT